MPWPAKQRTAIFLDIERRKGTAAAKAFMRAHGYGKKADARHRRRRTSVQHEAIEQLTRGGGK